MSPQESSESHEALAAGGGGFFNLNFSPYLPSDAKQRLMAYQYHGIDKSLIYKYMWKPLCASAVERLPVWLAPNVITVTALALVCVTHVMLALYMPNLTVVDGGVVPPSYVFVLTGVMLFVYQFLDNLDGHQARRTKTSSPLGLLMDHGCDAFNTIIGSVSVATAVCAGPTWKSWTVLITAVIVFFMNTWEEYYRGALILPIINGPNEGILVAIGIYFLTAVVGPTWWITNSITIGVASLPEVLQKSTFSPWCHELFLYLQLPAHYHERLIRNMYDADVNPSTGNANITILYNTLAVGFLVFSGTVTCFGNMFQVYRAVNGGNPEGHGKYGSGWFLKHCPFLHALTRLLPLLVINVLANAWFFHSPSHIFEQHPRIFCWTVGLLYTKLAIHLMIAHLCGVEFHPFRRTLVPFVYFAAHIAFTFWNRGEIPTFDEENTLYEFFILAVFTFWHLVLNAIRDTAHVLGVPIFTVPREKQQAFLAAAKKKAN
jgi:phosphatidylglycerophosphate synthase